MTTDTFDAVRASSVVVTGAARGIGAAIVRRLSDDGYAVVAVDSSADALHSTTTGRPRVRAVVGDVRDGAVLSRAAELAAELAPLYGWVNNAGIVRLASAHEMTDEHLDEVLDVNLRAVLVGCRVALHSFMSSGVRGSIVNISSIHGRAAFPRYAVYDVTKAGIEAMTRSVCVDYGHLGIRCNAVAPGAVDTTITQTEQDPTADADRARAVTASMAPLRRISRPAEIADAVAFLLSPEASSISGHVLAVDNGMSAWSFGFPAPE